MKDSTTGRNNRTKYKWRWWGAAMLLQQRNIGEAWQCDAANAAYLMSGHFNPTIVGSAAMSKRWQGESVFRNGVHRLRDKLSNTRRWWQQEGAIKPAPASRNKKDKGERVWRLYEKEMPWGTLRKKGKSFCGLYAGKVSHSFSPYPKVTQSSPSRRNNHHEKRSSKHHSNVPTAAVLSGKLAHERHPPRWGTALKEQLPNHMCLRTNDDQGNLKWKLWLSASGWVRPQTLPDVQVEINPS